MYVFSRFPRTDCTEHQPASDMAKLPPEPLEDHSEGPVILTQLDEPLIRLPKEEAT